MKPHTRFQIIEADITVLQGLPVVVAVVRQRLSSLEPSLQGGMISSGCQLDPKSYAPAKPLFMLIPYA